MPEATSFGFLGGVITVEKRADDFMAFITDMRGAWGAGKNLDEAVGSVVRAHPELVTEAIIERSEYVDRLRGAFQMTALALERAVADKPVTNVPHCMSAARSLLKGTNYELGET